MVQQKEQQERLVVLLPALNEAEAIGSVIDKVPVAILKDMGIETAIFVADGGSTDNTKEIAKGYNSNNLSIYTFYCGIGKGTQIAWALKLIKESDKRARNNKTSIHHGNFIDYLIMLDSDDTYPPEYIIPMVKRLRSNLCDVITGYRVWNKQSMSLLHSIGNRGLTTIANLLYSTKTKDLCTGYWGFNRKALEQIKITATGFELEANLFSEVNRLHLRFEQIPIQYLPRIGKSHLKLTHGFIIVKKLLAERFK